MARLGDGGELLKCSFCGKSQKQVKKLIAGPGVYICDECIDLCNEIIEEELSETSEVGLDELATRQRAQLLERGDVAIERGHRMAARAEQSCVTTAARGEIQRAVYAKVTWDF
mgnify:CR=1 FL=1